MWSVASGFLNHFHISSDQIDECTVCILCSAHSVTIHLLALIEVVNGEAEWICWRPTERHWLLQYNV